MSTGIKDAYYSHPYMGEQKEFSIDEDPPNSRDAPSYHKDETAHSASHDAAGYASLVNDGNPFPEDPSAPEETTQLTFRAVAVGCILGLIVGASNIYLGLKTGM